MRRRDRKRSKKHVKPTRVSQGRKLLCLAQQQLDTFAQSSKSGAEWLRVAGSQPQPVAAAIRAQVYERQPELLQEQATSSIQHDLASMITVAGVCPEYLQIFGRTVEALLRSLYAAGYVEAGIVLAFCASISLDRIKGVSIAHAHGATLARYSMLEGVYDFLAQYYESENAVSSKERETIARSMLSFIDEAMAPAMESKEATLLLIPSADALEEIKRCKVSLSHRRLTWTGTLALASGDVPRDQISDWIHLADEYDRIETAPNNSVGALANGMDKVAELIQTRPNLRSTFEPTLISLRNALETRIPRIQNPGILLELGKSRIAAALLLHERQRASAVVSSMLQIAQQQLTQTGANASVRSYVLQRGEDWIGLAARVEDGPGPLFESAFNIVRGEPPPLVQPIRNALIVRPLITREFSMHQVAHLGAAAVIQCTEAHEIGKSLDQLRQLSTNDVATFARGGVKADRWLKQIDRLTGMLRLRQVAQHAPTTAEIVIQVAGHALQIPWAGVFLRAGLPTQAISQSFRTRVRTKQPYRSDLLEPIRVINGFSAGEHWDLATRDVAVQLGAMVDTVTSRDDLIAAFTKPARMFILGCHGHSSRYGECSLQIGGQLVPVDSFVGSLCLSRHAPVFCAVCFGGSGFLAATGEWSSLPSLLLDAGALCVIANRWHAWDVSVLRSRMAGMLKKIGVSCVAPDAVSRIAADVRTWMQANSGEHPRNWCGWGVWTSGEPGNPW